MRRVTVEQWKKKVQKLFDESHGREYSLARFTEKGDDGKPCYLSDGSDEVLAALDEKQSGVYHVLDDDGKLVAECAIGRTGERESVKAFDANRMQAQVFGSMSEGWERANNSLQRDNDKLREERDRLLAKNEELREHNEELKETIREQELEKDDEDPMLSFMKEAFEFIKGRGIEAELMKRINERGILNRMSPELQGEVVQLLNSGALR